MLQDSCTHPDKAGAGLLLSRRSDQCNVPERWIVKRATSASCQAADPPVLRSGYIVSWLERVVSVDCCANVLTLLYFNCAQRQAELKSGGGTGDRRSVVQALHIDWKLIRYDWICLEVLHHIRKDRKSHYYQNQGNNQIAFSGFVLHRLRHDDMIFWNS